MTNKELNTTPYGGPASDKPFTTPQLHPKNPARVCSKCRSTAFEYLSPNFDNSTGPYLKCSNKSCEYVAEYFKFIPQDGAAPLGSSDPYHLLKEGKFDVVATRRTVPKERPSLNRGRNSKSEVIPKLANKPDVFLENLLKDRVGIITSLVDDEYYNDTQNDTKNDDRYS